MGRRLVLLALVVAAFAVNASPALASSPRGALRQLEGKAGCLTAKPRDDCGRLRRVRGLSDLALSPDGRHLYVIGDSVVAFRRDARTGRLRRLTGRGDCLSALGLPDCTAARGLELPSTVAISRDGRSVYVAEVDGGVAVLTRNARSGRLVQLPGPNGCVALDAREGCAVARALRGGRAEVAPDDRHVYVASAAWDTESVLAFARSPSDGALTQLAGADGCTSYSGQFGCRQRRGLENPAAFAFSPDGAFAYVPSRGSNLAPGGAIEIFARRPSDGALDAPPAGPPGCPDAWRPTAACGPGRTLDGANHAVTTPDGRHLYVAAFQRGVAVFRRDPSTGRLTQLSGTRGCVSSPARSGCTPARGIVTGIGYGTAQVTLARDARILYASSHTVGGGRGGIAVLRRDPASGAVSELAGSAGCLAARRAACAAVRGLKEAQALVLSPDGRHAYVLSDSETDAIAIFRVQR